MDGFCCHDDSSYSNSHEKLQRACVCVPVRYNSKDNNWEE
jgi:hypothetical protein